MSGSKHFDKIAIAVTALMLVVTVLFINGGALGIEAISKTTAGYEERLFDNSKVHTVDIVMNDWDDFIDNATSEEYYAANVVIDGEAYKNVAIRAKGNTSLSTVSSLGSRRYSFKIEFDHYDKAKLYHGLDKLSLNNLIQDSTMMKDYLTYTLMNEFDVNSSLSSFVYITVNGEDWGLYLAVEGVEEAFLQRNYGSNYGELYKPDSMSFGGGRGNGKDFDMSAFSFGDKSDSSENDTAKTQNNFDNFKNFDPSNFSKSDTQSDNFGKKDFGGGMGSSDVKLQYIDDDTDSYSNIWDNAKTDITESDKERLIASLKKLSEKEDIESVVDTEQVMRYFVVHNYVCNGDSYTGSMIHNYYLYEKDGQMAMLPWDYNLAFGTFQGGNANSTVNTPIDSPISGGSSSDRPMWDWIVSDEEYTDTYHKLFSEFLDNTDIQGIIDGAYELIKSYVQKDPTAFYTYDEFEKGVSTLKKFCELRSESISKQIENGDTSQTMSYADASSINLSDMGSMGGGVGDKGSTGGSVPGGNIPTKPENSDNFEFTLPSNGDTVQTSNISAATVSNMALNTANNANGSMPSMPEGGMPSGDMPSMPEGGMPSGDVPNMPEGGMPSGDMPNMPEGGMPGGDMPSMPSSDSSGVSSESESTSSTTQQNSQSDDTSDTTANSGVPSETDDKSKPSKGDSMPEMNKGANTEIATVIWLAVSVAVLALGLIVAKKYRA